MCLIFDSDNSPDGDAYAVPSLMTLSRSTGEQTCCDYSRSRLSLTLTMFFTIHRVSDLYHEGFTYRAIFVFVFILVRTFVR